METHIQPIADTTELLSCLDAGQVVYGVALQNTNVRNSPTVDACRVGRIPRGSLIEVVGAVQPRRITVSRAPSATTTFELASTVGYIEDVQPIFDRTCNSCHSAVVKNAGLQVTEYAPLLNGSTQGEVIAPGDPENSMLWQQLSAGKMPLVGRLSATELALIRDAASYPHKLSTDLA
jgi:hypothetical protein